MSLTEEARFGPADIAPDELRRLTERGIRPVLLAEGMDPLSLPKALNDLLAAVLRATARGETVVLMRENEDFTTQAAADFLGVSRQYLVQILEAGAIPFHRTGTHRRVFLKDLVQYQRQRSKKRKKALDKMTRDLVAADVYDRYVPLDRDGSDH